MRIVLDPPQLPDQFWEDKASGSPLPPRDSPCSDCAVVCGFYGEMVHELEKQPRNIQIGTVQSWFCHQTPDRACRGAIDHFHVTEDE